MTAAVHGAGWRRGERWLYGFLPIALTGILYAAMRLVQPLGVSARRVHLCDLRAGELALFGVMMNGRRVTLHDWFQAHHSPVLDVLCSIPYATFVAVCVAFAMWLCVRDYPRMLRFGWSFLALNLAAFATYHLYPAAPPWYFHAHGCAVDVRAPASEGPALARVDAMLGEPYFATVYARSTAVFGAMPSLHCAYALLVAIEGWATWGRVARGASLTFAGLMCFAAVYLDHHWVLDVVAGGAYCLVVVGAARALGRARAPRGGPSRWVRDAVP
jgi:inositol phosphorylceramide synthase catalytic subunit